MGVAIGVFGFYNVIQFFNEFTPYEQISLDVLFLIELLISLFAMFWSIEPDMPDLHWKRGD
jgi:hypothetical protein